MDLILFALECSRQENKLKGELVSTSKTDMSILVDYEFPSVPY